MTTLPAYPNNIGRRRRFIAIDGKHVWRRVVDEIAIPQRKRRGSHTKLIYLQKLLLEEHNQIQYRFTYYMLGLNGRTAGRWVFGQYSLVIPPHELKRLLSEAKKKGWRGF